MNFHQIKPVISFVLFNFCFTLIALPPLASADGDPHLSPVTGRHVPTTSDFNADKTPGGKLPSGSPFANDSPLSAPTPEPSSGDADVSSDSSLIVVPGDANGDELVDALDLAILRKNFGKQGASLEDGDANGDGQVDLLDQAIVRNNFGVNLHDAIQAASNPNFYYTINQTDAGAVLTLYEIRDFKVFSRVIISAEVGADEIGPVDVSLDGVVHAQYAVRDTVQSTLFGELSRLQYFEVTATGDEVKVQLALAAWINQDASFDQSHSFLYDEAGNLTGTLILHEQEIENSFPQSFSVLIGSGNTVFGEEVVELNTSFEQSSGILTAISWTTLEGKFYSFLVTPDGVIAEYRETLHQMSLGDGELVIQHEIGNDGIHHYFARVFVPGSEDPLVEFEIDPDFTVETGGNGEINVTAHTINGKEVGFAHSPNTQIGDFYIIEETIFSEAIQEELTRNSFYQIAAVDGTYVNQLMAQELFSGNGDDQFSGFERSSNGEISVAAYLINLVEVASQIYVRKTITEAGEEYYISAFGSQTFVSGPATFLELSFEESTGLITHLIAEMADGQTIEFNRISGEITVT